MDIDSPAQPKPGTYLFEVPGKSVSIYLGLDVIDQLQQDVMRGFGAVPKRGAEVGGILLGSTTPSGRQLVNVEDYEMVAIEYKRGPSYQLSPVDLETFQTALERLSAAAGDLRPVGFFRSNTRDSTGLVQDDFDFLDRFFPDPSAIVLLIKPYATRVSTATFLVRENGRFQSNPAPPEFPFRRKDVAPHDDTPPKRLRHSAPASPLRSPKDASMVRYQEQGLGPSQPSSDGYAEFSESDPDAIKPKPRGGWVWAPLSFIFLLLGVLLGFQAALTMRPQSAAGNSDPFNLQLNISKERDNLNVRWDRQALAIRSATRGVLVIVDGAYNKTVDLDPNQLQTGSVVYRHNSGEVRFRLEVYPRERDMIVETIDWKE